MMTASPNGAREIVRSFEWKEEYNTTLEQIALTDHVETEWTHLREMIKYKVDNNIRQYLSGDCDVAKITTAHNSPEQVSRSSPMSLPPSSPSTFAPSNTAPQGLVIPPFPRRERKKDPTIRIFNSIMDEKEANESKNQIFDQLDEFDTNPPFTIQRLCELCIGPRRHYKSVGKYLRALERTILVTSTADMYPSDIGDEDIAMTTTYNNNESLRLAMTPVFSPIPFLHDDARRSRSPSPFELAVTIRPGDSQDEFGRNTVATSSSRQALGLVDELDDPKPGHLADHPTALTAITSTPVTPPLSERFVKSKSANTEGGPRDTSKGRELPQSEDAEVEEMVLDDNVIEDEDKENRPSK